MFIKPNSTLFMWGFQATSVQRNQLDLVTARSMTAPIVLEAHEQKIEVDPDDIPHLIDILTSAYEMCQQQTENRQKEN